jgi:glycosyltransferase involved in cell wall biosynthesis
MASSLPTSNFDSLPCVGYVLKRYPRYSETFIVNEILAHEAAGLRIEIFALNPPNDSHFQDGIARVRAPVNYCWAEGLKGVDFWNALQSSSSVLPDVWSNLEAARGEDAREVYQALWIARSAQVKGIHHLHAHFATSATTVARLAARFAGMTFSFTAHAKDIYHQDVQLDEFRRNLLDASDVVTVSDYNRRFLSERFGSAAARVQRVYNGLDLNRFRFESPENRQPRIVAVCRLVEKKGIGDLVEACALLVERGCLFDCHIVGAGPLEPILRAQIARLGLDSCVQILGARPQNEVIRSIQDSAVLAAPCVISTDGDRDGLPTVLLEAMALGTPCVATEVTGIPELVQDGETGLLVGQRDLAALASALERLLAGPDLRVALAHRARRRIEADFEVHGNAARLRKFFQLPASLPAETLEEVA